MKKFTLVIGAIFISFFASAQLGGNGVYSFLNLSTPARIAALGGTFFAVNDNDPNPATMNPSLLKSSMNNMISFSGVKYYADIKGGDVSFTKFFEKAGTFQAAVHYINYGQFKYADIYGNVNGEFTAADNSLQVGWGYIANPYFSVGTNVRFIYSHLEEYTSYGVTGDIAVSYASDPESPFSLALVARNFGSQVKQYNESDEREPVKPEVMFGLSKKFSHAPFRILFTYRHIETFDYTYFSPITSETIDPLTGDKTITEITFWDKLSRHFILGTELVFSKNFSLRYAYNFQRRAEMKLEDRGGVSGMSFGFGLRVNRFDLAFGMAQYHQVGMSNHVTLTINPSGSFRKKTAPSEKIKEFFDSDRDGVEDHVDRCPDVAGLAEFNGCPDSDNDKIIDSLDACPTDSGLAMFNGCPDTDGDSIPDSEDDCPLVAGPVSNKGCPVVEKAPEPEVPVVVPLTEEEKEIVNKVFTNLEFEIGKAIISASSYSSLDELANLLTRKSTYKLNVDGHTDNIGEATYNQKLSESRANAVKKYLADKGIDPARVTAKGYGSTRPVASNNTREGRQRNRRVEFTILE